MEMPSLDENLEIYDAFTDIEFNPNKSINCQARSCALFLALGGTEPVAELVKDQAKFVQRLLETGYGSRPPSIESSPQTLF